MDERGSRFEVSILRELCERNLEEGLFTGDHEWFAN